MSNQSLFLLSKTEKRSSVNKNMEKEKLGYIEGWLSIVVNTLLFILKYWAGIMIGSLALIADAYHTLSDTLSSIIILVGIKFSTKKATKKHPFGFGRLEQIASLVVAFLLGIVAYEIIREAITSIETKQITQYGLTAIIVTIISILVKEGLAQFSFWAYRKTDYITLKADGWHHRSDALSSVLVLIGIFVKDYIPLIDSILGIIISLMLFYAVFDIAKEAIIKLIGEEPNESLIQDITELAESISNNKDLKLHHFHLHNYGQHRELTFHIKVKNETSVVDAHELATKIEDAISKKMSITTTIHIEPETKRNQK